ncbi:hypothetical protein RV134_350309 [Roseovarius sp. EC-HK134]|nr:hypothetical protein RV134_350309 [Roseovarius sp. EC-HK134]VVT30378.1 hypothetical protein RV420_410229 [Roseovarius sp. EC-SD190]
MPRRPRGFFFLAEETDISKPKGSDLDMGLTFASRRRECMPKRAELKGRRAKYSGSGRAFGA